LDLNCIGVDDRITDPTKLLAFDKSLLAKRHGRLLAIKKLSNFAKLDVGRELRKGLPEVILAEGKDPIDVSKITEAMVQRTGRAIVSRANTRFLAKIRSRKIRNTRIEFFPKSGMIVARSRSYKIRKTGGRVGILTAGTSDIPVAEEARIIVEEMGCDTREFYDVGVAGLHRLFKPLAELLNWDADTIIVIAGREGALPTVVAGLVDVPVIAVPTSRSYGFGDKGIAALAAMLQSCSLGLAVVNIDGGVGAGSISSLIANRAALGRKKRRGE
jgi:pyridinium-3,5-biscarboxylic acid mononucleotide synthase